MTGTTTDIAATTPSWWRQSGPSGEADAKEDVAGGPAAAAAGSGPGASFGFADLIDVINPLQHIPVVSTLYREFTGDQISQTARAMGGALYGGPVGLVAAIANSFSEAETGRDLGGNAVAMMNGAADGGGTANGMSTSATTVAQAPTARGSADGSPSMALPEQITLRHEDATATSSERSIGESPYGAAPRWPIAQTAATARPASRESVPDPTNPQPANQGPANQGTTNTSPMPPTTTAETLAAATATRVPRQDLPTLSERAFDRLMRNAGAQRASSVDNAGTAALSPAKTTRFASTTTPEGRESVQDWMLRALEKYERMKTPTAATGGSQTGAHAG